uniref:DNA ligase n=1 Tax=Acrobeloides nanus TaxID=290746 RepID=A0A914EI51_9BILA
MKYVYVFALFAILAVFSNAAPVGEDKADEAAPADAPKEQGITKADLCAYYEKIADRMLPLVNDRVVSLVRCPKGITGQKFFEKHCSASKGWPKAMKCVQVLEKNGHKASYEVCDAALEVRDLLLKYGGLKSVPMLTGGKGIHIIAPMIPSLTWPEVSDFAKNLAKFMEKSKPEKYISTSTKSKRKGLIFVDYLRNGRGATAVAPYSTRARQGAPVAAPITWEELKKADSASMYNVEKMLKRIEEPDPWEESYTWKQKLTPKTFK